MKILQKIEFWFFSVPALVVAIGGIAHYRAWRVPWVFPIGYTIVSLTQFSKGMIREVLDTPWTNGRGGRFAVGGSYQSSLWSASLRNEQRMSSIALSIGEMAQL